MKGNSVPRCLNDSGEAQTPRPRAVPKVRPSEILGCATFEEFPFPEPKTACSCES